MRMSAEPEPPSSYPWRAVTFWLFVLVVLVVLGFVGHLWYQRHEAERRLNRMVAELDRDEPGWRLEDLQAAREKIPDAEIGALVVISVGEKLPKSWPPAPVEDALV